MPDLTARAWECLNRARVTLNGRTLGVRASVDDTREKLNYDHCFVRDFAMCAPAFLLHGESGVVRDFLLTTIRMQAHTRRLRTFEPREGILPASFRPVPGESGTVLDADYGEESIARVTPIDSVFWWMITLRAYTVASGDTELANREECQEGIRRILRLVLEGSFEMFPTLLVPEGSFMIDRRMGVYGHPLEVQALFFMALRAADELLVGGDGLREAARERLRNLRMHVARFYWIDKDGLARLREETPDQFGEGVVNIYNVFPESIPDWVDDWLPDGAGYLAGNVGAGRIDFRFFAQGNLLAVTADLADDSEAHSLMNLYEARWRTLVGEAPLRLVYPALEGEAWRVVTGADTKNGPWQYHNGGSWPCLLWAFAPAAVAAGRMELLKRAVETAEERLDREDWPEYYDGRNEPRPGNRARSFQSWSMGGYLYARACLEDPAAADLYRWAERVTPEEATRT
ncbi:MAG: glycoside hydrolase 100 family protein [Gemmatimonadetes bacterium]|nr:glycoside hydrolase 100 family protein [Gemmatimonadota bacterium]